MPYKSIEEALKKKPNLKKYSKKAQEIWLDVFNSNFEKDVPEGVCFAKAYSAANKADGKKTINGSKITKDIIKENDVKKEMIFSSTKEAIQYLSDITNEKVIIGGKIKGPGIPDGTGPMSETSNCIVSEEQDISSNYKEAIDLYEKGFDSINKFFLSIRDMGASEKLLNQINKTHLELAKSFKMTKEELGL